MTTDPLSAFLAQIRERTTITNLTLSPRELAEFTWLAAHATTLPHGLSTIHNVATDSRDSEPSTAKPAEPDARPVNVQMAFANQETSKPLSKGRSDGVSGARKLVGLANSTLLEDPLGYARSLRRLSRMGTRSGHKVLDVSATVQQTAAAHALQLVLRDQPDHNTHLVLFLDRAGQVEPWRAALKKLVSLATESGVFASCDTVEVDLSRADKTAVFQGNQPFDGFAVPTSLTNCVRSGRHHVVLLLSDGVGFAFTSGALGLALNVFPEGSHILWAQLWEREHWHRSRLLRLRPEIPAALGGGARENIPIAVATFTSQGLAELGEFVQGHSSLGIEGLKLPTQLRAVKSVAKEVATLDMAEMVKRVVVAVQPVTLQLLSLAAAIPGWVNLPLLQALATRFCSCATRFHLAEAMSSGLFERTEGSDDRQVLLRLKSEARQVLLAQLDRAQVIEVMQLLLEHFSASDMKDNASGLQIPLALIVRTLSGEGEDGEEEEMSLEGVEMLDVVLGRQGSSRNFQRGSRGPSRPTTAALTGGTNRGRARAPGGAAAPAAAASAGGRAQPRAPNQFVESIEERRDARWAGAPVHSGDRVARSYVLGQLRGQTESIFAYDGVEFATDERVVLLLAVCTQDNAIKRLNQAIKALSVSTRSFLGNPRALYDDDGTLVVVASGEDASSVLDSVLNDRMTQPEKIPNDLPEHIAPYMGGVFLLEQEWRYAEQVGPSELVDATEIVRRAVLVVYAQICAATGKSPTVRAWRELSRGTFGGAIHKLEEKIGEQADLFQPSCIDITLEQEKISTLQWLAQMRNECAHGHAGAQSETVRVSELCAGLEALCTLGSHLRTFVGTEAKLRPLVVRRNVADWYVLDLTSGRYLNLRLGAKSTPLDADAKQWLASEEAQVKASAAEEGKALLDRHARLLRACAHLKSMEGVSSVALDVDLVSPIMPPVTELIDLVVYGEGGKIVALLIEHTGSGYESIGDLPRRETSHLRYCQGLFDVPFLGATNGEQFVWFRGDSTRKIHALPISSEPPWASSWALSKEGREHTTPQTPVPESVRWEYPPKAELSASVRRVFSKAQTKIRIIEAGIADSSSIEVFSRDLRAVFDDTESELKVVMSEFEQRGGVESKQLAQPGADALRKTLPVFAGALAGSGYAAAFATLGVLGGPVGLLAASVVPLIAGWMVRNPHRHQMVESCHAAITSLDAASAAMLEAINAS